MAEVSCAQTIFKRSLLGRFVSFLEKKPFTSFQQIESKSIVGNAKSKATLAVSSSAAGCTERTIAPNGHVVYHSSSQVPGPYEYRRHSQSLGGRVGRFHTGATWGDPAAGVY